MSAQPLFLLSGAAPRPQKGSQRRDALLLKDPAAWTKWGWMVDSVAVRHGVRIHEMLSTSREDRVSKARRDLCACLRGSGLSYPDIGRLVGMDHTSVMYAVRKELVG